MIALDEARSISDKDKHLLREVKAIVQRFAPSAQVILYGSVARGDQDPESDYDILVLTQGKISRETEDELEDALYDLQLAHGALLCTMIMPSAEWARPSTPLSPWFQREVNRDAVLL
jgi:predicted nucleotidyltransferase